MILFFVWSLVIEHESITGILRPNPNQSNGSTPILPTHEISHTAISWDGDGYNFLDVEGVIFCRLPSKEEHNGS